MATQLETLAEDIRRRRKRLRLTQVDLARLADVAERTVIAIESGKSTVKVDSLLRVLHAIGYDVTLVDSKVGSSDE